MRISLGTIALAAALTASAALCQTPAPSPAFEVASIKPSPPIDVNAIMSGKMHVGMKTDAARVDIGFLSLADLIRIAYNVKPYQISGPDWMGAQRFDIQAKIPEGASADQVPQMLQALLADRFKLTLHRDNTEHGIYALVVGKGGPKLKESPPDPPAPDTPVEPPKGAITIGTGSDQVSISGNPQSGQGMVISSAQTGKMHMTMSQEGTMQLALDKMTMPALADSLTAFVDRPVIDMTGLKGNYQVALDLSMADLMTVARSSGLSLPGMANMPAIAGPGPGKLGDAASDPSGSAIFSAVERLGLKLEPQKQPMERLIVDHLEKMPTEN
jgi:uncharacterized protein (TIGR03435 family)